MLVLLLWIRTLAGGGGGAAAAAAVSQKGLELSKHWSCLSMDGNVSTVQAYVYEDEQMLTCMCPAQQATTE